MNKAIPLVIGIAVIALGVFALSNPNSENKETYSQDISTKPDVSSQCLGTARCISGIVTSVIDGDTIKVDGQSIRFALVDAPELKYDGGQASSFVEELCPVGSAVVVDQDDNQLQDKYGRILGVIHCNGMNLNQEVLDSGLGDLYSAFCDQSEFSTQPWALKHGCGTFENEPTTQQTTNCDPSYPDFCIPSSSPDLDCGDISQKRFTVLQPDPHRLDADKDGIGCES
ncbi:excalibur domain-containing protein [Candidatus Nitrosopumilus koreensis AR1]|uniref:Excalibur domain-containing protein n=1 Tax=Candidatus Nitrosopumilus koreensis AR1 TaxID=1229908 RepID=K0BAK3_9ARCH|nr:MULTISPECIES: thermonuclease family protein [Nitrosopumilus]AFS81461.1 excalibur domain-containing protein [Candidatus Nitrosopumilus koreensis AR1]